MTLAVVFVFAGVTLGVAYWAQRGHRSCLCCRPRKRFPTVAERRWHEKIGHSL